MNPEAQEMPQFYPEEMLDWYRLYSKHPRDKLGHDSNLYLAEDILRRLATVAVSLYLSDTATPSRAITTHLRERLAFGQWSHLLQACLKEVPYIDLSSVDGSLVACARLRYAAGVLNSLHDSRVVTPLTEKMNDVNKGITWREGWDALVAYRNKTLGHPHPRVVGVQGFYESMTGHLAEAVSELLWSKPIADWLHKYQLAKFERYTPPGSFEVSYRSAGGFDTSGSFDGPDALVAKVTGLTDGSYLIVEVDGAGTPTFRARYVNPEMKWAPSSEGKGGTASAASVEGSAEVGSALPTSTPSVVTATSTDSLPHGLIVVTVGTIQIEANGSMVDMTLDRTFAIGRNLVTQSFFEQVTGVRPSARVGDDLPVESVSWLDCVRFCNALSEREHLEPVYKLDPRGKGLEAADLMRSGYRLPTEAEWVYSCLGGLSETQYPDLPNSAWYKDNSNGRTHPVGELATNGLGIADMLGNVWEWCHDAYIPTFPPPADVLPLNSRSERVLHGGSWNEPAKRVTPFARGNRFQTLHDQFTGFRIARSIPE